MRPAVFKIEGGKGKIAVSPEMAVVQSTTISEKDSHTQIERIGTRREAVVLSTVHNPTAIIMILDMTLKDAVNELAAARKEDVWNPDDSDS